MTISTDAPVVAVLGLGAIGLPIATHLADDLPVTAFDVDTARREMAKKEGVAVATSAVEACASADVAVVAVRDQTQLDEVLFGVDGIAMALAPGAVVILTSTIGRDGIVGVVDRLGERGILLVDAPLSGGPVRAGAGDLLVVVGASSAALERARPVLERMASTLTIVGPNPGDGQALKTVNQLLCGVHIAAAAEALALARALGLDPAATLEALGAGAAASFMLGNRGPRMLEAYDEGGAEVLSRLDIFVKDMGIVTKAARGVGVATPLAATAEQEYLLGQAQGLGRCDDSAVIKVMAPQI
ncbi:MAG: NAD(P)-dependent oxidoreductase [Propionibacteriaceae bacterium]|jgi:3-hydroxyisobutyrate dehydrogenase|nr:NAD(P)-dependent oxidoreductase [Propionibacteriaceae bacterium]